MKIGTVLSVNAKDSTVVVDVGVKDVNGNPIYLVDVPFDDDDPPNVGEKMSVTVQRGIIPSEADYGFGRKDGCVPQRFYVVDPGGHVATE